MPCYHPIRGLLSTSQSGKRSIHFGSSGHGKGIILPCGRCIGCRLERARQWAVRIMHESKMHSENSFLTLTYDEEHLPQDGSISVVELQKFFKKLRARLEPKRIRFFACGEYGERLERPHYHAIVFGWFPSDAVFLKGSGELSLWTSPLLSAAWGNGHASVGRVSFDSAAYVANYATKKINGDQADAHYQGRRPEFLVMSRRPGIGKIWLDKFPNDVYPSDRVIVRGVPCKPPRYYDKLMEKHDPEMMCRLKLRREVEGSKSEKYELRSGDCVDVVPTWNAYRLSAREIVAKAKLSLKKRSMEE